MLLDLGLRTWVSGPEFQDSNRHNGSSCCSLVVVFTWDCYSFPVASCYSSHLGLLFFSCCYDFFFSGPDSQDLALRTWVSGLRQTDACNVSYDRFIFFPSLFSASSGHKQTASSGSQTQSEKPEEGEALTFALS